MATVAEAFQVAFGHHQAGRLREAEGMYRNILQVDPNHADSWHLLGLVAYQVGRNDVAQQGIGRAIQLDGKRALFHSNLGTVLRAAGDLTAAENSLRRALELDPTLADAQNNLGNVLLDRGLLEAAAQAYREAIRLRDKFPEPLNNLATVLQQQGQLDEAIRFYRQAIEANPRYADAFSNLGTALKTQERFAEAADAYRQVLRLVPDSSSAHLNLGTVYQAEGRLEEAVASYREALRIDPRSALAENNLGTALRELGDEAEAIAAYQRALLIQPNLADAHFNLGVVWQSRGELDRATQAYRQALACNPRLLKALVQLGKLDQEEGRFDRALEMLERAVAVDPDSAIAHLHRASVYEIFGRWKDALDGYERALQLDPDWAEAYNNLALFHHGQGHLEKAVACARRGLEYAPDSAALTANLATYLMHRGQQAEAVRLARESIQLRTSNADEFSNLLYALNFLPDYDAERLFEEHRQWAAVHAEPLTALAKPLDNDPVPGRRLRVGYVSPYFREHAVNFFTEPLITSHDHEQFETFCYSDNRRNDAATERLKKSADHWREVRFLSHEALADRIREDRIDVLVDLSGHLALHRLQVFARRPAPVQVTYIGYQNTTGMSAMDYRLTDALADPPGLTDHLYTEKLHRLPGAFFCYRPAEDAPEVTPLPALMGKGITFGSFNNFSKVTPGVIETWIEILARVADSRLLVLASRGGHVEQTFREAARARSVDAQRIELFDRMSRTDYYRLIQQADIALDPFPFNGHTTTCDAIWLGVPVVMLQGDVYASRFGSSVLASVGLQRFITRSTQEYVERAVELARDIGQLSQLRNELRSRMRSSVLLDFAGFTRNVENAYREMWRQWCAGDTQASP